jgi:putative Ca2+/H+ antiporter (TMEM165/GDT1 family)
MAEFVLALVISIVCGCGARDQVLIGALSARQGRRAAVLAVAVGCAMIVAVFAAWIGAWLAGTMASLTIRQALIAAVMVAALVDLARVPQVRLPAEPTDSLGALALVLLVYQLRDGGRLLAVAVGLLAGANWPAVAAGAASGAAIMVAAGWQTGAALPFPALQAIRRWGGLGLCLCLCMLLLGWVRGNA